MLSLIPPLPSFSVPAPALLSLHQELLQSFPLLLLSLISKDYSGAQLGCMIGSLDCPAVSQDHLSSWFNCSLPQAGLCLHVFAQ